MKSNIATTGKKKNSNRICVFISQSAKTVDKGVTMTETTFHFQMNPARVAGT